MNRAIRIVLGCVVFALGALAGQWLAMSFEPDTFYPEKWDAPAYYIWVYLPCLAIVLIQSVAMPKWWWALWVSPFVIQLPGVAFASGLGNLWPFKFVNMAIMFVPAYGVAFGGAVVGRWMRTMGGRVRNGDSMDGS